MKKISIVLFLALACVLGQAGSAQAVQNAFSVSRSSVEIYYTIGGGLPTLQDATFTNVTDSTIYYTISVPNQPKWLNTGYATDQLPADPGVPNGIGVGVDPTGLTAGVYSTSINISGRFSDTPSNIVSGSVTGLSFSFPITLTVQPAGTSLPSNQPHPEGTNVVSPDGTVYRISGGSRYPYTSAGAFLSYGYNTWAAVASANAADMAMPIPSWTPSGSTASRTAFIAPRDGSLINDHGTVYIISDGYRQGFSSAQVFKNLGYSFANALPGDTSFLSTLSPINSDQITHPSGTVVNDHGTICVVQSLFKSSTGSPGRKCFASLNDMVSWGINSSQIIPANSLDHYLPMNGTIPAHTATSLMNP